MRPALAILLLTAGNLLSQVGNAYFYGEECRGKPMANGKPFNPGEMVCATWFHPLGTRLDVTRSYVCGTNIFNATVTVTVTDRGPAWRLVHSQNRVIDLSAAAFRKLADPALGHVLVYVRPAANNP